MSHSNWKNEDHTLVEITTRVNKINQIKYKRGRHDHENFLKSHRLDNDFFKRKYKSVNKESNCIYFWKFVVIFFNHNKIYSINC